MNTTQILPTSADTIKLASELALSYGHQPALIFLRGDLGAGKTTFAQSFIQSLQKTPEAVTSPTFSYMNTYEGKNVTIHHFDLYRIEDASEIEALGLAEFLLDQSALRLIEWPQIAKTILGPPNLDILFTHTCNGREAHISGV